jgi:SM-20-related protein
MIIDFDKIENAQVKDKPYPFFVVENCIKEDKKDAIAKAFPNILDSGVYSIDNFSLENNMQDLIDDLSSQRFRNIIEKKLNLNLADKNLLFNFRGFVKETDGLIHPDNPDKFVTILLYLNKHWITHRLPKNVPLKDSGCLRILNSATDINDYAVQIPPLLGNMVVFKVTENSFHGHLSHDCIRKSLQFNYWI